LDLGEFTPSTLYHGIPDFCSRINEQKVKKPMEMGFRLIERRRALTEIHQYSGFASQEQVEKWGPFSFLDGWSVKDSIEIAPDEIRLFDAPIVSRPFASLVAP